MSANKDQKSTSVIEQLKFYAETCIKLVKYETIEKGSTIFAEIIADITLILSMLSALLFASIAIAFYMAALFNSLLAGFGFVFLIYLFISLICAIFKNRIEMIVADKLLNKFLKR
jgi:hypothetical protein